MERIHSLLTLDSKELVYARLDSLLSLVKLWSVDIGLRLCKLV